ncbi:tRNA epoxyqueuosine(34) reductase QueG [bacterium]|nr:tRNA epoxyqueuosine(34) reductase QueG [bacterium]
MPTPATPPTIAREARLKSLALDLGFDTVRIASATDPWPATERLEHFIAEGRHGEMSWMETTIERRSHPTAMWPAARSAVVVGLSYAPERDPMEQLERRDEAAISVYAHGRDYHDLLKRRLKALARTHAAESGDEVKVFVDTAPLLEKPLAARAGVGWQGKHTNLVSREHGSWLFLGVMLTSSDLAPDAPGDDACGSCRACLDICPTAAFPAPYQLDARRCISYLTIELKGPIPREFRRALGNRIYGCDDCLAVCPWNKFAAASLEAALQMRPELDRRSLDDLSRLQDHDFRALFSGSAIKRIGRDRFVRNVVIALGNSGDAVMVDAVRERLEDPQAIVRGAAVWAFGRLTTPEAFDSERFRRLPNETDPSVIEEWHAGPDA